MQTNYALSLREESPLLRAFRSAQGSQARVIDQETDDVNLDRNHAHAVVAQQSTAERLGDAQKIVAALAAQVVADLVDVQLQNDAVLSKLDPEKPDHKNLIAAAGQVMEAAFDVGIKQVRSAGELLTNQAGSDIRDTTGSGEDVTNANDPLFGAMVLPSSFSQLHPVRDKDGNTTYKVVRRFGYE